MTTHTIITKLQLLGTLAPAYGFGHIAALDSLGPSRTEATPHRHDTIDSSHDEGLLDVKTVRRKARDIEL